MRVKTKISFRYSQIETKPFPSSNRKVTLFRPIIPITILFKKQFVRMETLIDSGADYNIFHGDVATYLGINLTRGSKRTIHGIAGKIKGYEHKVELKIDQIKFPSRITFSNQLPNNFICVLGGKGFFDHFQVNLDYNNKTITLS